MAFYDENDEEEKGADAQGGGVQTSAESGVISGSGGAGGSPQAPAQAQGAPDKAGNFVGLKTYLDANQRQAGKLGDQAAGVIGDSANQARQGVSALSQEAQEKVKPVGMLDQGLGQKLQSGAENLSGDERNAIKKTASSTYQGPQTEMDLNAYQNAADSTNKAVQNINSSGTEQGRMGLISQINAKPRTQGMNVFDNALLQAGGGREKLAQAATANQDVKGALGSAGEAIRGQIGRADDPNTPDVDESAGAIGQTDAARNDASKRVQDALSTWRSGFEPKVAQAQQALVDSQNNITKDIGDNPYNLSPETMQALGLSGDTHLYDLDLNSYLQPASPSDVNASNVASAEDYARYAALADLSGDKSGILKQENAGMAGTAPKMGVNFSKLNQDIKGAGKSFDQKFNNYQMSENDFAPAFASSDVHKPNVTALTMPAMNKSPAWLENVYLPHLQQLAQAGQLPKASDPLFGGTGGITSDWNGDDSQGFGMQTFQRAIKGLTESLSKWKSNQYYNNVVNPNVPNLPAAPGGKDGVDWGAITPPTGGPGKGGPLPTGPTETDEMIAKQKKKV